MAAVVPQPPLLIPELAAGAAADSAPLRTACLEAAGALAEVSTRWVALGADGHRRLTVPPSASGTFRGFGVEVPVALSPHAAGPPDPDLPLPMLVAGWLRGQVGGGLEVRGEVVPVDLATAGCRRIGSGLAADLAVTDDQVGLLVVGDGAASHTERAPGYLDERAGPFDEQVAAALAAANPDGLLALDPLLAAELQAVGRAPWQLLAAVALAAGGSWRGELTYSAAPHGVAYHVALWTRVGR